VSEERREYPATPRGVVKAIRALRESIFTKTTNPVQSYREYVSHLVEAAKSLEIIHPQISIDLEDTINELFRTRFDEEWTFGRITGDTLDNILQRAVDTLYQRMLKDKEKLSGRVVSEATLKREIELEILTILSKALENILIKYVFPPI